MKKYPFVKQEELKDCGISCVSMLVKYYKGFIKREKLIELSKTNKNGTTAYNIKNALENIGFNCKGISCNMSDINKDNIILPCIANVTINKSYKHFIIIYEINFDRKYLIIGDPADKIKKISFDEFEKIFNKVLIIAFPIRPIPIEKDINFFEFIKNIIKPNKKLITNIIILSCSSTSFSIITSFYIQSMIKFTNNYSFSLISFIFFIFFSIYILKIVSEYFRNVIMTYINQKIELNLTIDIFKKIINLPYRYYHNKQTGDIISKINDLDILRDMISKVALTMFIDLPLTFVSIIILYIINSTLFKIAILMLLFYFIILFIFKNKIYNYIDKIKKSKGNYLSFMIDSIKGFESIKGCHLEKSTISRLENKYVKFSTNMFKFQNVFYFQDFLKELINDIGYLIIVYIGCILIIKNKIELTTIITFISLLGYFLNPIKNILLLDNTIKESKISLKRILELIEYKINDPGIKENVERYDISFKNVDFTYNDRDYILKNINLDIKQNDKVMIIGKSGCGKSTLFKILMKYYPIENKKIFIGNVDINNYKEEAINNSIVYIGQNEILFNDTLCNNIMLDNNDSSKLLNVSNICEINDILNNNLGFNTLIEENGFNLSGGQKQRIILARAIMKKFDILIIDEGLSQVDINLERKILKNLFYEYKNKTIIFISHRMDNLDLFDSLIEFNNGQVKEAKRNRKYRYI